MMKLFKMAKMQMGKTRGVMMIGLFGMIMRKGGLERGKAQPHYSSSIEPLGSHRSLSVAHVNCKDAVIATMVSYLWYSIAALGETAGCFAFWAWLRLGKTPLWTIPGAASLAVFALALTRVDASNAGRSYAAYGGVYILGSILWLWRVEGVTPDRWDIIGCMICLVGSAVILLGPRSTLI